MSRISICGGRRLAGAVDVQGSKNAALPILAATILSGSESVISNCPDLADVRGAMEIIDRLGGKCELCEKTAVVNTEGLGKCEIPDSLMRCMRSSVLFLGALLSRMRHAVISYPGGCAIGLRPIDLHIKAFRELGVEVEETGGYIYCTLDRLRSATVDLKFPSVGATENLMLLAAVSDTETIITNAAREPEVVDLQNFLNAMGAKIFGAGSEIIRIEGVEKLHEVEYNIISDRIFSATVACATAACGGDVLLRGAENEHMRLMLAMLRDCGCETECKAEGIRLRSASRPRGLGRIITAPYPGFPTDAQALFMALCCTAEGTSVFVENIFESRYKHVAELVKMGADIIVDGRLAVVSGCNYIQGAQISAGDLRGGAALVVAGLSAIGDTEISGCEHIDRGYEHIEKTFSSLGARIKRTAF